MTSSFIALSLTEDYAPSWKLWEGVRELVQNWHDGCLETAVWMKDSLIWLHLRDVGDEAKENGVGGSAFSKDILYT